jgi:secondary thiamine-phosphate synthase enzyme
MIESHFLQLETRGENDIINITDDIKKIIHQSGLSSGSVVIFVPGATGALSTIEYEPGLIKDLPELMDTLIPKKKQYHHNETWQDGNGHSHLRATLIGPSLTIPFENKEPILGTWQQIVFLEFDNKSRKRKIFTQLIGE